MKPLHDELKEIRIEKGITLDDIYRETKIRIPFLEKIEEGDFSVVPALFMRAFLREYAEAVGLDQDRVLSKYDGKAVSVRDDEKEKCDAVKAEETETSSSLAVQEISTAEVIPEAPDLPWADTEKISEPVIEKTSSESPSSMKMISDEIDGSGSSDTPLPRRERLFPEEDESRSPRAFIFGIFVLIILLATLAILYLEGIITF